MGAGKAADLTYWEGAARVIASVSKSSKIIVEKSTVPVKTAEAIEKVRRCCSRVAGRWAGGPELAALLWVLGAGAGLSLQGVS